MREYFCQMRGPFGSALNWIKTLFFRIWREIQACRYKNFLICIIRWFYEWRRGEWICNSINRDIRFSHRNFFVEDKSPHGSHGLISSPRSLRVPVFIILSLMIERRIFKNFLQIETHGCACIFHRTHKPFCNLVAVLEAAKLDRKKEPYLRF